MAKATIAFSKARGKVGGLVFRHDAGIGTVVSEYNPHPSNPRTIAQTKQRGKMNLAGKISQLVEKQLLVGLSVNGRKARSMFVSNLLKNIQVPSVITPGTPATSTIDFSKVVFAKGAPYGGVAGVTFDVVDEDDVVRVTLSRVAADDALVGGIAIVVYSEGGQVVNVLHKAMTLSANGLSADLPVEGISAGTGYVCAYVIPLVSTDEGLAVTYGNLLETGTYQEARFETDILTTLVQGGAYRHSEYAGVANFV